MEFLRGENLLETLHLNLVNKELVEVALGENKWGEPVWENPVPHLKSAPPFPSAPVESPSAYTRQPVPQSYAAATATASASSGASAHHPASRAMKVYPKLTH